MTYFNYRAIDDKSRIIKGRIEASDEYELDETLSSKGLKLIEATKSRFVLKSKPKLTEKDLISFTYFLNLILSSGIPIMSGLENIAQQTANKKISVAASLIKSKLEAGKSISDSMLEYPKIFPTYYTSMVRAGEVSGSLEQVLNDLMSYLEWHIKLKKNISSALAYPSMVLTAVASLIAILFIFVMPKFIKILTDLKVALPLPTKILIFTVGFLKGYWPLVILFVISLPVVYRVIYNTATGRRIIDISILKIPLFGELVRKLNHSRYFRTFATLYKSGMSMDETLRVSADVVKNTMISDSLYRVTNAVLGGEQLNRALKNSGDFSPLLLNMVEIGENTGTLDTTIIKISDIYDKAITENMKRIFTIMEPIVILLLGGIVLLTLASFFLPLYKIVGGIHK